MVVAGLAWGGGGAIAGMLLLRVAWQRWSRRTAGPAILILALAGFGWTLDDAAADKAVALALLTPSLVAVPLLLWGAEWKRRVRGRNPRPSVTASPVERHGRWWRGVARFLCAGPLSGLAAVGCGTLIALRAPWDEADRLVFGGFLVPVIWAAAGVWSTTDRRVGTIAAGLGAIAALSFGMAAL